MEIARNPAQIRVASDPDRAAIEAAGTACPRPPEPGSRSGGRRARSWSKGKGVRVLGPAGRDRLHRRLSRDGAGPVTDSQDNQLRRDALTEVGCGRIFEWTATTRPVRLVAEVSGYRPVRGG